MSGDDLDIRLGQSVRRHIERKAAPSDDSRFSTAPYDDPQSDQIPVYIAEKVLRAVERHAAAVKDTEVGGVLLGGFYRTDKGSFVEITDFIEARQADGSDTSLTFTHETWEHINAEQARRGPASQIVGWYHSHPGLGVFMSREDEFIHSSYFADPWHVALVVDPIYHNWGCFKWRDGNLERTGGFYVFAEKKQAKKLRDYVKTIESARRPASRPANASADRRDVGIQVTLLWAAVALLAAALVVVGYLALRPEQRPDYYRQAIRLLQRSDLTGGAYYLKLALAEDPTNQRCYADLERLNRILSDPRIARLDNERLDEVNAMLAAADDLAKKKPDYRQPGVAQEFTGKKQGQPETAPRAPREVAAERYARAAITRHARLARARLVRDIVHAELNLASRGVDKSAARNAWYTNAVKWLEGESQRHKDYSSTDTGK